MNKRLFFLVLLIQFLATLFYAAGVADLRYSFIGDEYATYEFAKGIATGEVQINLFSPEGVYGENPVMGSVYQATVMKIFGINIYGWKLSSMLIIFPLGLLMFYMIKKLSDVKTAFTSLIMLDMSFYLHNFFQIGYLNNLSLLTLVVIMYLLAHIEARSRQDYIWFFALGLLTGLSWYFYIGKLFIFIVTAYLLIYFKFNPKLYKYFYLFSFLPSFWSL